MRAREREREVGRQEERDSLSTAWRGSVRACPPVGLARESVRLNAIVASCEMRLRGMRS